MQKVITILGPTASGKTELAVNISNKINAEIVSADSRQIYKYMDIGTGKDLDEYIINNSKIPYHLIDILDPEVNYSVYDFQRDCLYAIELILANGKTPLICGGTGLYLESFLLNYKINSASPNVKLRDNFDNKNNVELIQILKSIENSHYQEGYHNTKRRLVRAIEIAMDNKDSRINMKNVHVNTRFNNLVIGIKIERNELLNLIKKRLYFRMENGMINEVETLINKYNLSINRLKYFGLEYKYIAMYLNNEFSYNELLEKLNIAINQFSKRQMTFFRRMEKRGIKIHWVNSQSDSAAKLVDSFLL